MQRTALLSLSAIAAVALVWLLTRSGDPRDAAPGQSPSPPAPRVAPLAERNGSGAERQGVAVAEPRAADLSGSPDPSGTGVAQADGAGSTGEAPQLALVAPSSGQAGAGEAPFHPGGQPGSLAFRGFAAPGMTGSPAGSAPELSAAAPGDSASAEAAQGDPASSEAAPGAPVPTEAAPPAEEVASSQGPLTREQVAEKVNEALQDVPPDQKEAVAPIVIKEIVTNAGQAADWAGPIPAN